MSVKDGRLLDIQRAVDSILCQTLRQLEFLIVNDGSTQKDVAEYLASLERIDSRIRVYFQQNQGLTRSLNTLVNYATSPLCARMDADDVSLPERLERQVSCLHHRSEVGVVGCWVRFVTHEGKTMRVWRLPDSSAYVKEELEKGNTIVHSSVMFRKQLVASLGGYDERLQTSQDYRLWRQCARHAEFAIVQEVLHEQYITPDTITMARTEEQRKSNWLIKRAAIVESETGGNGLDTALREYAGDKKKFDSIFMQQAESYRATVWAMTGHPLRAMQSILKSITLSPRTFKTFVKVPMLWMYSMAFFCRNLRAGGKSR